MESEDINVLMKNYNSKNLKTKNIRLTKYERTRVISERASQIENGSKVLISNPQSFSNSYQIAVEELNQKKIPFIIKRPYNNSFEYIKLNDLL
jgi:DNA-directed RNA polymerase subunit K/omega